MSLNYTTIEALINSKYIPMLYDNIFKKNHLFARKLKDKAKTYNERKIVVPLEYANISQAQWTAQYGPVTLQPGECVTAAEYTPKMLTDSIVFSLEEELLANSDMAVKNLIDVKMKNLQKGMELFWIRALWARSTATNGWTALIDLVSNTATAGGIAVADATWWESQVLTGADFTGDITVEADLCDPTKDTYLKKILQRGIAKSKYLTGEDPDMIVMPQYLWDLCEFILDPQKTGSKMDEKVASMGFDNIKYRNSVLVADDDMVYAQTGDTDGYMYFLNTDYFYMFFNSGAKFSMQPFVRPANQNAKSALFNAYGNTVISNRAAQCVITGFASPKTYGASSNA